MAAMAFALSDSAVGVVFPPEVFGVGEGVGFGRLLRVAKLRPAELLSPCGARAPARVGLTKTPALLVRSPSCARAKSEHTNTKASAMTHADKNFPPRFNSGSPPPTNSRERAALY